MGYYAFHDLSLKVQPEALESRAQLAEFFSKLSMLRTDKPVEKPLHQLTIGLQLERCPAPPAAAMQLQMDGFTGYEQGNSFYLNVGSSAFQIPLRLHTGASLFGSIIL